MVAFFVIVEIKVRMPHRIRYKVSEKMTTVYEEEIRVSSLEGVIKLRLCSFFSLPHSTIFTKGSDSLPHH
jgi:hypothetical protein